MEILAAVSVFVGLATVAVTLRLYTRLRILRSPTLDDCTIVVALIADLVFFSLIVLDTRLGLGQRGPELDAYDKQSLLKLLWAIVPIYNLSLILTKISILILYLRLFPYRVFAISVRSLMAILLLFGAWTTLSGFLFCIPVSAYWDISTASHIAGRDKNCLPKAPVWLFNASMNIVTDVVILLMPMPSFAMVNWPWRQKIAVMVIFGVGILVCATSVVRVVILVKLLEDTHFFLRNSSLTVWSSIECNLAILCACLPALRPLLLRISHLSRKHLPFHHQHHSHWYRWSSGGLHKRPKKQYPLQPLSKLSIYQGSGAYFSASISGGPLTAASLASSADHPAACLPENTDMSGIKVVRELTMETRNLTDSQQHAWCGHMGAPGLHIAGRGVCGFNEGAELTNPHSQRV